MNEYVKSVTRYTGLLGDTVGDELGDALGDAVGDALGDSPGGIFWFPSSFFVFFGFFGQSCSW